MYPLKRSGGAFPTTKLIRVLQNIFSQKPESMFFTFFQQWEDGKRRIKEVTVTPLPDEELNYPVLWSPETHESSPFAHLEIITGGFGEELMKIYSLEREDGKKLYIAMIEIMAMQMIAKEYEDIKEIEGWIIKNFTQDMIAK